MSSPGKPLKPIRCVKIHRVEFHSMLVCRWKRRPPRTATWSSRSATSASSCPPRTATVTTTSRARAPRSPRDTAARRREKREGDTRTTRTMRVQIAWCLSPAANAAFAEPFQAAQRASRRLRRVHATARARRALFLRESPSRLRTRGAECLRLLAGGCGDETALAFSAKEANFHTASIDEFGRFRISLVLNFHTEWLESGSSARDDRELERIRTGLLWLFSEHTLHRPNRRLETRGPNRKNGTRDSILPK